MDRYAARIGPDAQYESAGEGPLVSWMLSHCDGLGESECLPWSSGLGTRVVGVWTLPGTNAALFAVEQFGDVACYLVQPVGTSIRFDQAEHGWWGVLAWISGLPLHG